MMDIIKIYCNSFSWFNESLIWKEFCEPVKQDDDDDHTFNVKGLYVTIDRSLHVLIFYRLYVSEL